MDLNDKREAVNNFIGIFLILLGLVGSIALFWWWILTLAQGQ